MLGAYAALAWVVDGYLIKEPGMKYEDCKKSVSFVIPFVPVNKRYLETVVTVFTPAVLLSVLIILG